MKFFFNKESLLKYNSDSSKIDCCIYRVVLDGFRFQFQVVLGRVISYFWVESIRFFGFEVSVQLMEEVD